MALVIEDKMEIPLFVTPKELICAGLDPAVVWNMDRNKKIKSSIFIVSVLKNGYSSDVIDVLGDYFGKERVIHALLEYKEKVSPRLYRTVENRFALV